jgi:uncharacterized protein (TIGR00255 family)
MLSMTGFGAGRAAVEGEEISVELRAVNHKFCEVKVRAPRELATLEPVTVKTVKDRLARGAIEVFVKRQSTSAAGTVPTVDLVMVREYRKAFAQIAREIGAPNDVRVQDIVGQQGVMRLEEPTVNLEHAATALAQALDQALVGLAEMRRKEGDALKVDLSTRLGIVEAAAREVEALVPRAIEEYRKRLTERIAELAKGVAVDPQRLAQEVVFFAERTDVAEEVTRLASHVVQFKGLVASPEPSGRKLDFLVQEMHREVNTTGSKSQHPEISSRVVAMKAELERIREQVQNVE